MPLTFEQFKALRDKGLSTQQITDFEAGKTPAGTKPQTDVLGGTLNIPTTSRTSTPAVIPQKSSLLGTVAAGVASPYAKTLATLLSIGASAYKGAKATGQLIAGDKEAALRTAIEAGEPVEIEGTIFRPVGSAKEAVGAGIQIGTQVAAPGSALVSKLGVPVKSLLGKVISYGTTGGFFGTGKALEEERPAEEVIKAGITGAAVSAAIPITGAAIKGVGRFLGGMMKRFAGAITGKGTQTIDAIIDNPQDALFGLRNESSKVLSRNSRTIRNTVQEINKQAQDDYAKALDDLPKALGRPAKILSSKGTTTIKAGGQTIKLSSKGMKAYLTKQLRNFNVKVDPSKTALNFFESPLRTSEEKILRDTFNVINKWTDFTPKGIDRLAVKIGNFVKPGDQSNALNSILRGLKSNVRNYLGVRIPEAKVMVDAFAQTQDFLDDISSALNVKGAFGSSKGVRMTSNRLAGIFGNNKELVLPLIETIEQQAGVGIIGSEAGRQLAQAPSRASVSIGDFLKNLTQTVIPPKTVGMLAVGAGITRQKSQAIITGLNKIAPQVRVLFLNALTELISGDSGKE